MRRSLFALVCGSAVAALGCGGSPSTPKVDAALEAEQNKNQKQADDEERAMQKQQNKGQKSADAEERDMQNKNKR